MLDALNEHLNVEFNSSYFYLSMSAYFESINLFGHAHWMNIQQQEETQHAMKFYRYIFDRGGRAILGKIDVPPLEWKSPVHVFEEALKHERMITERINKLVSLSLQSSDFTTHNFLQWFLNEQVEEEATFVNILHQAKMVHDTPQGLYMVDKDLSGRILKASGTK